MDEAFRDIKEKLLNGKYKNEEHVRFSLVGRLLHLLGWDVWNPAEVNTEFPPVPNEDRTKVDIALFTTNHSPSVFIEVKAVGKLIPNLTTVERQVRDYNRNNNAMFSVITDGRVWRFYYSLTSGEFHQKCYEECDLIEDDLERLKQTFSLFLKKENIINGSSEEEARKYLQRTNIQKAVQDYLPEAKRLIQSPPFSSLPQEISKLVEQNTGFDISESEIANLLSQMPEPIASLQSPHELPPQVVSAVTIQSTQRTTSNTPTSLLDPYNPGDLRFTRVEGSINGIKGRKWKDLIHIGIRLAIEQGHEVRMLNTQLQANVKEGIDNSNGYCPVQSLNVSVQGIQATGAAKTLVQLAKLLECPLELNISWHKGLHEGEQGIISLGP